MAKKKSSALQLNTIEEFVRWAASVVPDRSRLGVSGHYSHSRDEGFVQASFRVYVDLRLDSRSAEKSSHSLHDLALWLVREAIPSVTPPPPPPPRKKLTVVRPLLTHTEPERLF